MPDDLDPTEDQTPLRSTLPDHKWFPCVHCGRMNQCPPVALPANHDTTALLKKNPTATTEGDDGADDPAEDEPFS